MPVFSRPKSERYFIDYADKVALLTIVVLYVAGIINGIAIENAFRWFGTLPFILLMILLYDPLFRRFAYSVSVDLERNEYTFVMFRKRGSFTIKGHEVGRIYLNFFITFYLEGKKVLYLGVDDKQFLRLLKSHTNISYGKFWTFTSKWGNNEGQE